MVHPICLPQQPFESNDKWNGQNVDVVGYAQQIGQPVIGLKVTEMQIYPQKICNDLLEEKQTQHEDCNYLFIISNIQF